MDTGTARRLARLNSGQDGRALLVALDHGLTGGPPKGLESFSAAKSWVDNPAITGLVMHRGTLKTLTGRGMALQKPVLLQSNGMSRWAQNPSDKPILASAEDAVRLGADGLSVEFCAERGSFGENLRAIARQIGAADQYGLPVMVMLSITDAPNDGDEWVEMHRAITRTLIEIGATFIKVRQPPTKDLWRPYLEGICNDACIVMAGGGVDEPSRVVGRLGAGLRSGALGMCVGRNIFQHLDPAQFLAEIASLPMGRNVTVADGSLGEQAREAEAGK